MTRTDFFHRMVASIVERFTTASPRILPIAADAAIKGAIVLALVGLATLAMRRSSAAARHLAWFAGTLSLLLLPVFSLVAPSWHVLPTWTSAAAINIARPLPVERFADTPSQQNPAAIDTQSRQPDAATSPLVSRSETTAVPLAARPVAPAIAPAPSAILFTRQSVILFVWLVGSLFLLAQITFGFLSLAWLRHRSSKITAGNLIAAIREIATELGIHRPVEILSSSQRSMPMIWGLRRICVLLPADAADWSAEQCRVVLLHELAHARRFDCQTQLVAQLACALFWFNPLVWLARWRMQIDREQACDDLVLTSGTKASAYAEQLVRIAAQMPTPHYSAAAIAMARPSTLESRVRAILDPSRNRRRLAATAAILLIVAVGLCAAALASLRAAESDEHAGLSYADRWASQHGWKVEMVEPVAFATPEQAEKAVLAIDESEEGDVRTVAALAAKVNGHLESEPEFSDRSTREKLDEILRRRPDYFYAEFVLALWQRQHGNGAEADRLLAASYEHAPAVLVQRYELADGTPLVGAEIRSISLGCNLPGRNKYGSVRYAALGLNYPSLRTDSDACVYMPTYKTVYQMIERSAPQGLASSEPLLQQSLAAEAKVNVLPVVKLNFSPGDFAPTASPTDPPVSVAALPDGNTVEMMAISPYPNPKNICWRPDGSPSDEHFDTDAGPTFSPWPGDGRRLVFQFANPVQSGSDYQLQFSLRTAAGSYPSAGEHPRRQFVAFEFFPAGAKKVSIRLGVSGGSWKELASYESGNDLTVGSLPAGFEFERPEPWLSGTELRVLAPDSSIQLRMFAIDSQRHEHSSTAAMYSQSIATDSRSGVQNPSQEKREIGFMFEKLPPKEIVAYRLESRKYQYVEFSNVSIAPVEPKKPLGAAQLPPPSGFGRVVDIQNRPIGGAKLSQKQLKWSATCDASGLFRLPKPLSPKQYGQFDLSAAAPGFVSRDYVVFTFVPKGSLLNPNTPDMNPAPKLGDDGIIRLQRLGRVEGTVLGLNGKPLAKAPIELDVRDHFESMTSMIGGAAHAMTDANGRFAMSHVPPGDLLIYYPGWNGRPPVKGVATAVAVNLADGQALRNVVLDLSKSTAIATGQVLDKDGKPVAAANVTLQWRTDTGWSAVASMFQAKSDNDGRYRLEKLPQGNWAISATIGHTYGEPVAVVLSGDKPAHLDLVLPVVHALSGRIRRVQPMNPSDTVQEWIDATLAGDRDGASAVVAPGSPFDRNSGRLRPLLKQIQRFTSSSGYGQSPRGDAITNTLDFGGGRQGTIKFKMIRQGEAWLIDDAVDENDKSLVGERSE